MNPNVIVFMIFGTSVGFFFGGSHYAALGLTISSGLSFVASLISK